MSEIRNAKITDTAIIMGDHGCLTFMIRFESGDLCVSYGGYCIGYGFLGSDTFTAENGSGLVAMMRIMDVVGVERWEDLKGKYVRFVDDAWGSPVRKIGNIIEDKWFDIDKFFKEYGKENDKNHSSRE